MSHRQEPQGCLARSAAILVTLALLVASPAAAQSPRAAVLQSSAPTDDPQMASLAAAMDRLLRARLDALGVVDMTGTPVLDLADLQLAVGCVGETDECLAMVGAQLEVDVMVFASLARAGAATVVTITRFDASGPSSRRAGRSFTGTSVETDALEGIEPMLRELFDLPAAPDPAPAPAPAPTPAPAPSPTPAPTPTPTPAPTPDSGPSLHPIPVAIAGAGAALMLGGVIAGARANRAESDYADADPPTDEAGVDQLLSRHDVARRRARTSTAMFVLGAGAALTGGVLFFVLRGDSHDAEVGAVALPGGAAVALRGRFGGAS